MKKDNHFKVCPSCDFIWKNREDFLNDTGVEFIGYQVHFKELKAGLFLFNHSCKGTLAIKVSFFADLYNGPIFQKRATGTDDCSGFCLYEKNFDPCPVECECAFVREIIQIIK